MSGSDQKPPFTADAGAHALAPPPIVGGGYAAEYAAPPALYDDGGFDVTGVGGGDSSAPFSPWLLLRYKWSAILIAVLLSAALVPLVWMFVIPEYSATAVVRVSPVVPVYVYRHEENGLLPLYKSFLNTQVAVVKSPKVLQRVLDDAEVQATDWYAGPDSRPGREPLPPLVRLRKALSVQPMGDTELINVRMTTEQPKDAYVIANKVVKEYLEVARGAEKEHETDRIRKLRDEADAKRSEIEGLVTAKIAMARELGTDDPSELRKAAATRKHDLTQRIKEVQTELALTKWRLQRLKGEGEGDEQEAEKETVRYAEDAEWRRRRDALAAARQALEIEQYSLGERHPRILALKTRVERAEQLLAERESELDQQGAVPITFAQASEMTPAYTRSSLESTLEELRYKEGLLLADLEQQNEWVDYINERARDLMEYEQKIGPQRADLNAIRQRLDVLLIESKAPGRISVAADAIMPAEPSRDRRVILTLFALAMSCGAGVGVAFLRAFFDTSMRQDKDVTSVVRVPFLGCLIKADSEQQLLDEGNEELQESVRMVRTALLDRLANKGGCSVLITSPDAQAGKTTAAMLLARSLAVIGKKVLLVDADIRRRGLTQRVDAEGKAGLTELLHGLVTDESAVVPSGLQGVDVLPAGNHISDQDPEMMANGVFSRCMSDWKRRYDYIVLDSPPVLPVADARILATQADETVLTLRASHTRKTDAVAAMSQLSAAGCRPLGTVLVGADRQLSSPDSGYYYRARVVGASGGA